MAGVMAASASGMKFSTKLPMIALLYQSVYEMAILPSHNCIYKLFEQGNLFTLLE